MKVWILHHHLLTGGVTSVIHTQSAAFENSGQDFEVVVGDAAGRTPGGKTPLEFEGLNYLPRGLESGDLKDRRSDLKAFLAPLAQSGLLHVHNLNLGKNPLLNLVIADLLAEGAKVVNHCHDFAEDNRPLNIEHLNNVVCKTFGEELESVLYPKNRSLAYVVINQADRQLLKSHGIDDSCIFDGPNAISPPPPMKAGARADVLTRLHLNDRPLVLYPVRAIERKNIPELLLLCCLFKEKANFAVTQPAKNPLEVEAVKPWIELADQLKLPVVFEAGLKANFLSLMYGCDLVVSTSINEGFGLGFLEPWLFGKAVVGRDLPQVTSDFRKKGLSFPSLYQTLKIEGEDFSTLDDSKKLNIIEKASKNPTVAKSILDENQLNDFLTSPTPELIEANAQKILTEYSVESYGQNLKQIYATSF